MLGRLAQKGFFDPKKDDVLVILSDVPLAGTTLTGSSFDDVPFTYDATFSAPVAPRAKK